MEEISGLQCFWGENKKHPQCPHGPTLLFGRYVDGNLEKFYACSACRDRNLCKFYLKEGMKLTKQHQAAWDMEKKKKMPPYNHQKLYIRFNELLAESPFQRNYCHNCERLFSTTEKFKHKDHSVTENLTDDQMNFPTEVLKPLDNAKKEAQYLFSKKSVEDIVSILYKLGAKQVLCIGTPRIHEYITEECVGNVSSLLLDLDGRFHNFFGPLNYCWYNLFNHHFFTEEAEDVFKEFMTLNNGKDTYVVCDPPFGGRVEPISQTMKTISDLHKKWNKLKDSDDDLKIMFIFPYYMEGVMREKSNPPGISGGLKDLKMTDYKVDYDNHPLFVTGENGKKQGSVVRMFTNIPLNLIELPESDGYKYCKRCDKWVSQENKHCKKCKSCTSKDGKRYRHCDLCQRCVKPTWKHCSTCNRCMLEKHKCGQKPKFSGSCFKCNEFGHFERDCTKDSENTNTTNVKKGKKRKSANISKTPEVNGSTESKKMKIQVAQDKTKKKDKHKKQINGPSTDKRKKQIAEKKAVESTVKKIKKHKVPSEGESLQTDRFSARENPQNENRNETYEGSKLVHKKFTSQSDPVKNKLNKEKGNIRKMTTKLKKKDKLKASALGKKITTKKLKKKKVT